MIVEDMEIIANRMITTTNTDTYADELFQHEADDENI